jgi:diaminopimelate epimerase
MKLKFSKYHGTGNDFIIIDGISNKIDLDSCKIKELCDRRFGIGADGLMILGKSDDYDFSMIYYNSDGNEGSMCGNGGRCIVDFAGKMGLISNNAQFEAIDGTHEAEILNNGQIKLKMNNVEQIRTYPDGWFLNTGSPHFVKQVPDISAVNIEKEGRQLRYDTRFSPKGTNVNFFSINNQNVSAITFERGVEAETLSCGTGAVAIGLVIIENNFIETQPVLINTKGGELQVECAKHDKVYTDNYLTGPVVKVFDGVYCL